MGVTLQQIAKYLDNLGWKYDLEPEADRIITDVQAANVEEF